MSSEFARLLVCPTEQPSEQIEGVGTLLALASSASGGIFAGSNAGGVSCKGALQPVASSVSSSGISHGLSGFRAGIVNHLSASILASLFFVALGTVGQQALFGSSGSFVCELCPLLV